MSGATEENSTSPELEAEGIKALTLEARNKILGAFEGQRGRNRALLDEIVFILETKLSRSGVKIHDIEKRIKEPDSVLRKCERKGVQDHNLLIDVVGARVVCLFRSDMARIEEVLKANFDVLEIDDKLSRNGSLGYQSTHYVCQLPSRFSGPRYDDTAGVKFEVQVRTLCMHAWAAVSHHLDYKGDWDVPEDLKRALSALGGLFYVADNEFEQFYAARLRSKAQAEKNKEELNLDTIVPFLEKKIPDRKQPDSGRASKLLRDLKGYGYETISDLEEVLDRGADAFRAYERKHPPSGGQFVAEGVVRVTDRIVYNRESALPAHREFLRLVKPKSSE
ncbi:hypothetical protein PMI42_07264 [Bradyrhizobium sp. YR681]|uniref:GTP pyrophosphokinase n=1 Tax=Bradyrhizobium sp. YR681 TaxID=1144344 RepID=UPI00026F6BE2|nr:hypothetical protein [Bradyrhizobium sp. YR681]EJN08389.1 hypothetical protein PMI42_07264 [Bradyrhizobium sp. YR681]